MTQAPDDPVPPAGFDLDAFLPYRLNVAAAQVSRAFAERYRTEFGLSIAEWRVLAHLSQAGEVSVRDIEARTDLEKSRVSRAVARLETAGHVTRRVNASDRRLLHLALTERGRDLVRRLVPVARAYEADLLARLGPEAEALDRALRRIGG